MPLKTCTYDCIYCQLGRTTCKTVERKEWVPLDDVLGELEGHLDRGADYVTLGGSGEPTLFSRLDEVIRGIKRRTTVPLAVLTNGSLLWDDEVRRQLAEADVVIPSLDAGDAALLARVNRPHEAISFDRVIDGLTAFRGQFSGRYWLEVFLVEGLSATDDQLAKIRWLAAQIRPDRVQLNTTVRPPAEEWSTAVSEQRLQEIAATFDPPAEVVARRVAEPATTLCPPAAWRSVHARHSRAAQSPRAGEILALLERRPCSAHELAEGLAMHVAEVAKDLDRLMQAGLVEPTRLAGQLFFRAVSPRP